MYEHFNQFEHRSTKFYKILYDAIEEIYKEQQTKKHKHVEILIYISFSSD